MTTWLVVGLGNPGPAYASHRHNVGHLVVAELARRARVVLSPARMLHAQTAQTRIASLGIGAVGPDAQAVVLLTSRTYMNESGRATGKAVRYYKTEPGKLVVVHDELDLDFGRMRVKFGGGDNGHNGLKSIRAALGTGDFFRVRVGVGRPPGRQEPADYVLSPFSAAERKDLDTEVVRAADAVESLMLVGLEATQTRYNG